MTRVEIWREIFRPLIATVLTENSGTSRKVTRKALRAAFPVNVKYEGAVVRAWEREIESQTGYRLHYHTMYWFQSQQKCPIYAQYWLNRKH